MTRRHPPQPKRVAMLYGPIASTNMRSAFKYDDNSSIKDWKTCGGEFLSLPRTYFTAINYIFSFFSHVGNVRFHCSCRSRYSSLVYVQTAVILRRGGRRQSNLRLSTSVRRGGRRQSKTYDDSLFRSVAKPQSKSALPILRLYLQLEIDK